DIGPRPTSGPCGFGCAASGWWLQRVEPLLGAVYVLTRSCLLVLVHPRRRARANDVADAVGLAEREVAVADVELVAVEGANGRAGRPIALLVVLAAWARAPQHAL